MEVVRSKAEARIPVPTGCSLGIMIDLQVERVVTMSEATRILPRRRSGKHLPLNPCYRWARHGLRGVRLETIRIGGTLYTSAEHTSELQSRFGISYAVFCLKKKKI